MYSYGHVKKKERKKTTMINEVKKTEFAIGGKTVVIETGKYAKSAATYSA